MNMQPEAKNMRNLKALFLLAAVLCVLAIVGGALILSVGYSRPDVTQPMWQFGQYILFMGVVNLAVYFGIYLQIRAMRRGL